MLTVVVENVVSLLAKSCSRHCNGILWGAALFGFLFVKHGNLEKSAAEKSVNVRAADLNVAGLYRGAQSRGKSELDYLVLADENAVMINAPAFDTDHISKIGFLKSPIHYICSSM